MYDGSTRTLINFVHVSTIPRTERNPEKQGSTPEVQYFLSVLSRSPRGWGDSRNPSEVEKTKNIGADRVSITYYKL